MQTHTTKKDLVLLFFKLHTLSHTVISVLLISVRNHTVHFIGQFILNARNRLTGSARYEVRSSVLHLVQAHVTGFSDLPLGKAHKLRVPGVNTEALGDQDLTRKKAEEQWCKIRKCKIMILATHSLSLTHRHACLSNYYCVQNTENFISWKSHFLQHSYENEKVLNISLKISEFLQYK